MGGAQAAGSGEGEDAGQNALWPNPNAGDLSSPYAYTNDLMAIAPHTGRLLERIPVPSPEPPYGVAAFHGTLYVLGNTTATPPSSGSSRGAIWRPSSTGAEASLRGTWPRCRIWRCVGKASIASPPQRPASTAILVTRLALPSLTTMERWTLPARGGFACAPGGVVVVQQYSNGHALTILRNGMARVAPSFGPTTVHANLVVIGHRLWVPQLLLRPASTGCPY